MWSSWLCEEIKSIRQVGTSVQNVQCQRVWPLLRYSQKYILCDQFGSNLLFTFLNVFTIHFQNLVNFELFVPSLFLSEQN